MQGLANAKGVCVGELIIIRDVTDEMRVEEALKVANTKLSLISNITRHDMLNQMVVVRGYASLIADHPECEENARCVERITRAVFTMEHLITFAKDYQQFGLEAPVWQRLDNIVRMAKATVPPDKVKVTIDVEEIEVFGDLMLERVFYNLFDNSIQHGGNVRSIMVSARKVGNDLSILFEDDGDGIPEEDRERLFEWGFGKNTGLGLAMCRQILTMSEWKIVLGSNGGKGAKFEITVPVKGWRWAG